MSKGFQIRSLVGRQNGYGQKVRSSPFWTKFRHFFAFCSQNFLFKFLSLVGRQWGYGKKVRSSPFLTKFRHFFVIYSQNFFFKFRSLVGRQWGYGKKVRSSPFLTKFRLDDHHNIYLGLGDEFLFVVNSSVVVAFWTCRGFVESWLLTTNPRRFFDFFYFKILLLI